MIHSSSNAVDVVTWNWSDGQLPERHPIYHDAAYQQLFAGYDGSTARVLEGRIGDNKVYLSILVKELGGGVQEAYSAYGYGGFLGERSLSEDDVDRLKAFLVSKSLIALFVRHSPFLGNQKLIPPQLSELNRYTYSTSLKHHDSFDDFISALSQKVRWSVNYAKRSGVVITFSALADSDEYGAVSAFYDLYRRLMVQKQTSAYYLFSDRFFRDHARLVGQYCELAEIIDPSSGRLMGGAFFLLDKTGLVHYHLSAASKEAMKLQGMEYLMASAMHRYGQQGYQTIHLGGGHSLDEQDGLSRFKSKFASERHEFCCSKIICDENAYRQERSRLPLTNQSLFLISDARGV